MRIPKAFQRILPDAHFRIFNYDKDGNPKPRKRIIGNPLIAKDIDAVEWLAQEILKNPDVDMKKLEQWLWLRNARAQAIMTEQVREYIENKNRAMNEHFEAKVKALGQELKQLNTEAKKVAPDFEASRLKVGAEVEKGRVFFPTDVGRFAPDVIAGKFDIARGRGKPWYSPLITWMVTIGSGAILGASLGFLTGKLELDRPRVGPLVVFVGAGILAFTGIGMALRPFNFKLGQFSFGLHHGKGVPRWVIPTMTALVVLIATAGVMIIDSNVEQFGLLKAVSAKASHLGFSVTAEQMRWISLVVVVPALLTYLLPAQADGYELAASDKIRSIQETEIEKVASSDEAAQFARLAMVYSPLREEILKKTTLVETLEAAISFDLKDEDKKQIQEVTDDNIDYSERAEAATGFTTYTKVSSSSASGAGSSSPWWARLRPRRS